MSWQSAGALSGSQFNPGRIIDDTKFFVGGDMTATQIQNFLNSKVPSCDSNGDQSYGGTTRRAYAASQGEPTPFICLKNKTGQIQNRPAESGLCSQMTFKDNRSAAQMIYNVSKACGISAKVMLVLLQKEQVLVTDDWPWKIQYRSATGYGCPDGGSCDSDYYGFFNQLYNAARQFKLYKLNPGSYNYRAGATSYIQYNPDQSCGGSNVYIQNQATAGLYNYTPYQPNSSALNNLYGEGNSCGAYGNRNFWRLYNDWFGQSTTSSCINGANFDEENSGREIVQNSGSLLYTRMNKTGSACTEIHQWNSSLSGWKTNIPTNLKSQRPDNKKIISGDVLGDDKDETILVKYASGSGKVELHVWDNSLQKWALNTATNLNSFDPSIGRIIASDTNNDGKDELIFVKYQNTAAGKVEVHIWHHGYKKWRRHYTTNVSEMNTRTNRVISSNIVGGERDELVYIKYDNTGSGKVEAHVWSQDGYKTWKANYASNLSSFDPAL